MAVKARAALSLGVASILLALTLGCRLYNPAVVAVVAPPDPNAPTIVKLPNKSGSLKFAVLGDFGTGYKGEYEVADRMTMMLTGYKIEFVLTVGDNLYGAERPQDFKLKFEDPYRKLLDAGVKFRATLGNHDARTQRDYKLFNLEGKFYYSFKPTHQNVRFFLLDSTYPVPEQIEWIEKELKDSNEDWKIVVFHHPLYSSGGRHGSDLRLREILEPLFIKYNVSVVLAGHDHFYERIKPQHGIVHVVVGSGGMLAVGDIDKNSTITAKGYDLDHVFMLVEIIDNKMWFSAVTRTGEIVDSGIIERRELPKP